MEADISPRRIPVLKPSLPTAERIAPWLARIDESRWYSNFGPLENLFRERLGRLAGLETDQVALFCSGTAALSVALRLMTGGQGGLCLMPSWTHIGTAAAARAAGLEPFLLDCDARTWALDLETVRRCAGQANVRAVVPVAPFGSAIDYAAWDALGQELGLAVVIDAAASFDQFLGSGGAIPWGRTPVMVSLHATKVVGVGEGGMLLSADGDFAERTRKVSNFGIYDDLPIDDAFGNFKLSEYAAAVGLAFLEMWPERRGLLEAQSAEMAAAFARLGVLTAPGFGGPHVSSTCMVSVPGRSIAELESSLGAAGVDIRRWWRGGLHSLPSFAACAREALPNTERLAASFTGIPFYPGSMDSFGQVEAALEQSKPRS